MAIEFLIFAENICDLQICSSHYKQGNYKKAVEEFKIALSINPDFEIAKKNLKLLGKDEYK